MNTRMPKRIAIIGGALICVGGVINTVLGVHMGALLYEVYPGRRMGHVGIISGIVAIVIGLVILLFVTSMYERRNRTTLAAAGVLTAMLGLAGAIAGALYVGTVGMALCCIAGIWLVVTAIIDYSKHS